jgi:arabinogalactan oligomer / maltooligosaccharide transport system substrate-binding protein
MKNFFPVALASALAALGVFVDTGCSNKSGPVTVTLWTQEAATANAFRFAESLAGAYTAANPLVKFEVVNKESDSLARDFIASSKAGNGPDLIWTIGDHIAPFKEAGLIRSVDGLFDLTKFADPALAALKLPGSDSTWGVPISVGLHLMLLYNRGLIPTPPADTDQLVEAAKALTKGQVYGLAFNETEPFWLIPWLGGFKGRVFAADGKTPTLDTTAMRSALSWYYDLKYTYKVVPPEADYATADTLFKEGKAAMLIGGDWALGDYRVKLGDKLGVARIPMVKSTGAYPAPYFTGKFFLIPKRLSGWKVKPVQDFVRFATDRDNQLAMEAKLQRLPVLKEALASVAIANDPVLRGSADQMLVGLPLPTVPAMRAIWDSMKPEMIAVLAGKKNPDEAAAAMQKSAAARIAAMND